MTHDARVKMYLKLSRRELADMLATRDDAPAPIIPQPMPSWPPQPPAHFPYRYPLEGPTVTQPSPWQPFTTCVSGNTITPGAC